MFLLLCRLLRFLLILSLLLCTTGAARASKLGVAQACASHGGGAWRGGAEERRKEERVEVAGRPSRFLATMPPFTVWRGARAVWRGARTGCRRGCPSPCGKERPRPDDEAACHGLTTRPDDEAISTPPPPLSPPQPPPRSPRLKQWRYDGADDMHVRLLLARRMYLLLIDARRDKEGQGGWKERHSALLELVVTLFCTALLSEKQDWIVVAYVVCKKYRIKLRLSLNVFGGAHLRLSLQRLFLSPNLPASLPSSLPNSLSS